MPQEKKNNNFNGIVSNQKKLHFSISWFTVLSRPFTFPPLQFTFFARFTPAEPEYKRLFRHCTRTQDSGILLLSRKL